jgi:very-short-patch-repair endonuclease
VNPRDIFRATDTKYWFDCLKCCHQFKISISHISINNRWCPYCSNQKLCDKDCKICHDKSFASSDKAQYWSDQNEIRARDAFKSSGKKYWFNCHLCNNDYEAILRDISIGMWCSCTINKTETKLFNHLKEKYINNEFIHSFSIDWCKNPETNRNLPFDFVSHSLKLIIELDGRQQFEQVSNWQTPEESQKRDNFKMKQANLNGYNIIRILQLDVWFDKNDWNDKLDNAITEIKNKETPSIIKLFNK